IEEPETPADPNGGTFEGWEDEDGEEVEFPYNVPDEEDKEITITPVYHYTVIYDAEGATVHTVKNRAGSDLEVPEAPAKEGYKFIMWADADGKTPADYATIPEKNVTFNAIYEVSAYQIYYYVNGELVANKSAEYGETIVTGVDADAKKVNILTYSTPEGYEFDGWYTDSAMTTKLADGATVGAAKVYLYAKETAGTYDATFMVDDEVYETVPTVYGKEIVLPEEPTKEGYTFLGWTPNAIIMDAEGMTFEATWVETAGAYTATYYVDGEMYGKPFAMAYGDELDVPADPDKEGYTFVGWATKSDATPEEVVDLTGATMPAHDVEYYAVFTINNYTVNFNNNLALDESPYMSEETEVYSTDDYDYAEPVVIPADPTNINSAYYTFMGWTDVKGGTEAKYTAESVLPMPADDLELYAVYERVGVKLIPGDGSTTVIERDGVKESIAAGSVTNVPYDTEGYTDEDFDKAWFVYGLKEGLTQKTFEAGNYVAVQGDGEIRITANRGRMGTGAVIEVYDNVTGERVEKFIVIIFGDLNGDAKISSPDSGLLKDELSDPSWSATKTRVEYMFRAANVSGDRKVSSADSGRLSDAISKIKTIDQVTGKAS
ncbi:MAG: InlB B-repeat-containing protein, partial [Clostridia bacterium]|nr:InlB B-repeat-containing protein [Clostridia bacterium]